MGKVLGAEPTVTSSAWDSRVRFPRGLTSELAVQSKQKPQAEKDGKGVLSAEGRPSLWPEDLRVCPMWLNSKPFKGVWINLPAPKTTGSQSLYWTKSIKLISLESEKTTSETVQTGLGI